MPGRRKKTVEKQPVQVAKICHETGESDIVILFADVIGCSEISNHKRIGQYNEFITSFQQCFKDVCSHYSREEYKTHERQFFQFQTRGDEGCLKIFIPGRGDSLSKDVDVAINIALDLKRKWLLGACPSNN